MLKVTNLLNAGIKTANASKIRPFWREEEKEEYFKIGFDRLSELENTYLISSENFNTMSAISVQTKSVLLEFDSPLQLKNKVHAIVFSLFYLRISCWKSLKGKKWFNKGKQSSFNKTWHQLQAIGDSELFLNLLLTWFNLRNVLKILIKNRLNSWTEWCHFWKQ